jgi:hypothetical protein
VPKRRIKKALSSGARFGNFVAAVNAEASQSMAKDLKLDYFVRAS